MRATLFLAGLLIAAVALRADGQGLRPIPADPPVAAPTGTVFPAAPTGTVAPAAPAGNVMPAAPPGGFPRRPMVSPPPTTGTFPPPATMSTSPPAAMSTAPPAGMPFGTAPSSAAPSSAAPTVTPGEAAADGSTDAAGESRPRLAETLLARSLTIEGTLQTTPLTLANALANVYDAQRQLAVVDAYWGAAAAMGNHTVRREVVKRLELISPRPADEAIVRSARSAAAASLREAELLLQEARYELAERVGLIPGGALPIPADPPHVGTYRTNANWILPATSILSRARLIDRVLPLRHRAIENRAAAVLQAEEALSAAEQQYRGGQIEIDALLSFVRQYSGQHRAFLASVDAYNHDIVEYVVAVMQGPLPADRMVSMLIKPSRAAPGFQTDTNVEPAAAMETRPDAAWKSHDPTRSPAAPSAGAPSATAPWGTQPRNTPTPAPPRDEPGVPSPAGGAAPQPGQPTLAPTRAPALAPTRAPTGTPTLAPTLAPRWPEDNDPSDPAAAPLPNEGPHPDGATPPSEPARANSASPSSPASASNPAPPSDVPPADASSTSPTPAPLERVAPEREDPAESAPNETPNESQDGEPTRAVPEAAPTRTTHTANRPVGDESLYAGLAELQPANRAVQLTAILHWDRDLPEEMGREITLAECLRRNLNPDRTGLIRAYWTARRYATEYQLLLRETEFLEKLDVEAAAYTSNDLDRRRLSMARHSAEAAVLETRVALLAAQYNLTVTDGSHFEPRWLYPSTAPAVAPPLAPENPAPETAIPSTGSFSIQLGPFPVTSWSTLNRARRRGADLVRARHAELLQRADAVVESDAARARRLTEYREGTASLAGVLESHRRHTEATFEFLATVNAYNVERAEAVLTRFPVNGSTDSLVRELGCN